MAGQKSGEQIGAYVASVRAEEMPPEVIHLAARAFVDTFASAIAGRAEPASRIARDYALEDGGPGPSTLWTTGERRRAEDAALVNGVAGHVLDYDDVSGPQRGHPSVALLPAVVALGEAVDATGGQVAAAFAVGYEVLIKLSRAMAYEHYVKGWHSTSTLGVIGAAAGCAHLLGLSAERTAWAVGLAVAQASGCRRSFGTMAKSFQPATAAASAIRAARLAARGFTAPADALEGGFGYMDLYGNGEALDPHLDTLGEPPLELVSAGIEVKKYPCCYGTHRAVEGVLDLNAEKPIPASRVQRVRVTAHPTGLTSLLYSRPTRGLEAKFSLEYAVATALLDGAVRLSSFTDAAVQRPEAQALLRKVEKYEEDSDPALRRALVEIDLDDGERRSIKVTELRGGPSLPLTDQELEEKLRDCAASVGSRMDVDAFLASVWAWSDRPMRAVLQNVQLV